MPGNECIQLISNTEAETQMLDFRSDSPVQPNPKELLYKLQRLRMADDLANPRHISWFKLSFCCFYIRCMQIYDFFTDLPNFSVVLKFEKSSPDFKNMCFIYSQNSLSFETINMFLKVSMVLSVVKN